MTPKTKTTIPEGFVKMGDRKIYTVGGSSVMVGIPADILKEAGAKPGDIVEIYKNSGSQMLVVFK